MTWHEHLNRLPHKGEITIVSGSTSVMTTINGFVGNFQPVMSFLIAAIAGFFTIWVGWLAVSEKKLQRAIALQKAKQDRELHDLVMKKQQLEILELKKRYEKD